MSFDIKNAMMWQKMSPFPWTLQMKMVAYLFFVLLGSVPAFAQTGMLKGVLTDESGGVVAGTKVTLADSSGQIRETVSNKEGTIRFRIHPSATTCSWPLPRSSLFRSQPRSG